MNYNNCRLLRSGFLLINRQLNTVWSKRISSKSTKATRITVTDDGTTIVCWHPKQKFPYEHSLPYVEDSACESSALNVETFAKGKNLYNQNSGVMLEELQAITFTPQHVWKRRRDDDFQLRPTHPRPGV